MNIGVGLPTSTSGISGQLLVDWAKRADAGPFSSLGVVDRVAYQNYEPFTALAAAAAVTQRVRLATMVVIAPLRNTAILAKQAASVHALSDGRFTLGLAVGARGEDYAVSGIDSRGRGRRFGEQLEAIRDIWEEGTIGPTPTSAGPQLLVGGSSGEALARMARYSDGYMHGGGPARAFAGVHVADRKSTRLNSSHPSISYAVFCLKKKKSNISTNRNNLISGVDRCIHLNAMKKTTITSINRQTIKI